MNEIRITVSSKFNIVNRIMNKFQVFCCEHLEISDSSKYGEISGYGCWYDDDIQKDMTNFSIQHPDLQFHIYGKNKKELWHAMAKNGQFERKNITIPDINIV